MLTMAILAIIGAFTFGFVLGGLFAVGAAADRSARPTQYDGHGSPEVALVRAALVPRRGRSSDGYSPLASSSTRLQGRRRRSAGPVRKREDQSLRKARRIS